MPENAGKQKNRIIPEPVFRGIALMLFGVLLFAAAQMVPVPKTAQYELVILGDSIYGDCRGRDSVSGKLAQQLPYTVYNGALGGTCMGHREDRKFRDDAMDLLSMESFSKSIVSGDFGVQKQTKVRLAVTEYFPEVLGELERIDFSRVKILLIGHGLNDYQNGILPEDPENPLDEKTYAGALRLAVGRIRERFPDLRLILTTPTYSWYRSAGKSCEEADWGGGVLSGFVETEKRLAKELGIECIDLYGLYQQFEDGDSECTTDGVHPNEKGRQLIADAIIQYLEENP